MQKKTQTTKGRKNIERCYQKVDKTGSRDQTLASDRCFAYVFLVAFFLAFPKQNKRVCSFRILTKSAVHVMSLECFCSQSQKRYYASK